MTNECEILWCGKGPKGVFDAARLLGTAFALSGQGRYALAIPPSEPSSERALVRAYTKLSDAPLHDRNVAARPDHLVCFREDLLDRLSDLYLAQGGALVLANDEVRSFSQQILGSPEVGTALACLLAIHLGTIDEAAFEVGVREAMPQDTWEKQTELVRTIYDNPFELRMSAVHIVHAPKPKPHEQNPASAAFEYMNLSTADGFRKPHKEYRPGATSEDDVQ